MMHKSFRGHATVKAAPEGIAEVVISAYGNVDSDGDIVVKGASQKQIDGAYGPNPKGLLDHDWTMRSAVAKTLGWWEEDDGLHVEAQYNLDKEAGRDAFSDLGFYGADMEFSVGYLVKAAVKPDETQKAQGARRIITEWQIDEWSHVMLGANSETRVVSAKARRGGTKAVVGSYEYLSERLGEALQMTFPSQWLYVRATLPDKVIFDRCDEMSYETSTFEVAYTDDAGVFTFGEPMPVTIAEIVEPKSKAPDEEPTVFLDLRVAKFRHLVATTR